MSYLYTQAYLQSRISAGIQGKIGVLIDPMETTNETVRQVYGDTRLRSSKRRLPLVPNLYSQEFEYSCPSDLDGPGIIDVPQQAKRSDGEFTLVPVEQFLRWHRKGDISINDFNGIRQLLIDSRVQDQTIVVDALSSVDVEGGSWTPIGDAENLVANTDNFTNGNGSLSFDIDASGGTTAGISITGKTATDLSQYIGLVAALFLNVQLPEIDGITNFKLQLGNDAGDYWEQTVTMRNDGTAFAPGWNTLRFDMNSLIQTGNPVASAITYISIFMTKATNKQSEQGFLLNWLTAKKGKYADVLYYSKFGWQDASGAYKESATLPTDVLVADTDEVNLMIKCGRWLAMQEADGLEPSIARLATSYSEALKAYQMRNPSEDKIYISSYYDYGIQDHYNLSDLSRNNQSTTGSQQSWDGGGKWDP